MHTFPHQVAEGLRGVAVAPAREEIARRVAQVAAGRFRRPVLVLGSDGASGPSRPESARGRRPGPARPRARRARWRHAWRAAKGGRFSWLDGERIVPVLSWHQVQTAGDLAAAWRQVQEAGVLPEDRVRLGVMGDGAEWSWQHVEALLPQACQGLGYYPGGEYLHQVANAPYSDSLRALQWVEATLPRLYLGKVGQGLGGLRRRQPTSAEALQAMDNGWVSLNSHRGRTYYRRLRRGG